MGKEGSTAEIGNGGFQTRNIAQVADIADVVRQRADALMLSGESAVGLWPEKAVGVLRATATRIEEWVRCRFPPFCYTLQCCNQYTSLTELPSRVDLLVSALFCTSSIQGLATFVLLEVQEPRFPPGSAAGVWYSALAGRASPVCCACQR